MAAQENRILTDKFTELNVRMRGFGIYTMPRMCSQRMQTSGSHTAEPNHTNTRTTIQLYKVTSNE